MNQSTNRKKRNKWIKGLLNISDSTTTVGLASISVTLISSASLIDLFAERPWNLSMNPPFFGIVTVSVLGLLAAVFSFILALLMLLYARKTKSDRNDKQVFIIYSHKSKDRALMISNIVREAGFSPWTVDNNVTPGELWNKEIEKAIMQSSLAIAIIDKNSENSRFFNKELRVAMGNMISSSKFKPNIIPVIFEEGIINSTLSHIQHLDFREEGAKRKLGVVIRDYFDDKM